ncbi:MAG: hypothetical protein IKW05_05670 [Muribaculaceae bacterium]|nr:hypothetical protein [Muribaculaceae bacterium]MBR5533063.1 hypothetical protein [Bacteroidales bacterium]
MKTEKNTIIDLTSQLDKIAEGKGFYSVFTDEQQRNSRPSRKAINGLKELFVLLYNPSTELQTKEKSLNRLSQLVKKVLVLYENSTPKDFLQMLKKRIFKLCDKLKRGNSKESYNPTIEEYVNTIPEYTEERLSEAQKNEIYNKLLANGVSHEEALNELIKY